MRSLPAALLAALALALAPLASADPGEISTVAGTGEAGYGGEGVAATAAKLDGPVAVAPLSGGGFLISEGGGSRVRLVSGSGAITTVAGLANGQAGYNGDAIAATAAQLNHPQGIAAARPRRLPDRRQRQPPGARWSTPPGRSRRWPGPGSPATAATSCSRPRSRSTTRSGSRRGRTAGS